MSTSPPISAHLVARLLAQEHGVPWVADFRDFWTIYRVEDTYRDQRMVTRGKRLLAAIVEQASEVTVVSDAIADYLGRGEVITNGYDSDLAIRWKDPPQGERFTIGLPGHQHETREVRPLLRLLAMLRDQHPAQFEKVCLLQVGQIDARWFRRLLGEHGLQTPVSIRSQQKRRDTIRILSACHLFYLGISEREGPGFLPGRTFELIASGRPIVSYTQPGSQLARLLEGTGRVFCFQDDNIANAVEYLRGQIVAFEDGSYTYAPLSEYALQFSDHVLAKKFASVFERLL